MAAATGLAACAGAIGAPTDPPAPAADAQAPTPRENFFSSVKQAFQQDYDHEVVRGHFDVGLPPDVHRYYCLVDAKTGKSEPNGVPGETFLRKDGMTGIKAKAVSIYECASAEQQGILATTGYVLSGGASRAAIPAATAPASVRLPAPPPPPASPPPAASPPLASSTPQNPAAAVLPGVAPDKIDVAGVRLGMSPDEVRVVLESKLLLDHFESMQIIGSRDSSVGAAPLSAGKRFVNIIAAWTAPSSVSDAPADGESYEVMFTPVPGRERAMAIVHSMSYSPPNAPREAPLKNGLAKKYGGFAGANDLPDSPTWRIQSGGNVLIGDPCNRRGLFGGLGSAGVLGSAGGLGSAGMLGSAGVGNVPRQNLALKTTLDEFQFQIEHCGVVIVTEDHSAASDRASPEGRVITRFTVTAYSPEIGFEGASSAAQMIRAGGEALSKAAPVRTKDTPTPNL